ncbi:MarR family transcriptional regulator [Candidatus Megaera venefica]|jgi:DNA-binding MarR family transcriptional regulator|uniref:MarR family transcriptional regulator n=2 Tax=Candidatus Megaera venefica TaxID=2055910 RepID=A0ABU5NAA4_9RICK|nr:MarR family transcriptional regulator [Candidatus Megaera venefica]
MIMSNNYPSNLEDHLGYWLRCLSNYIHHSFAALLAEHDISVAQWVVLRTLYDKQNISLNEAARLVGVDNSSLSRMIERLVQKNLVSRTNIDKDRRSVQLSLTSTGKALVPKLAQLADKNDESFFQILSTQKRQELLDTIKQLLETNGWDQLTRGKDRIE